MGTIWNLYGIGQFVILFIFIIPTIYFYFSDNLDRIVIFGSFSSIFFFTMTLIAIVLYLVLESFNLSFDVFYPNSYTVYGNIISLIITPFMILIHIFLYLHRSKQVILKPEDIKKKLLELSTQYASIKISELSKICNSDMGLTSKIVKNMIIKGEIYGEYFKSTKRIAFDQLANQRDIDNLMKNFQEWEENLYFKKK